MSLAGQPLGGWGQYSLSPTMSAWSAHLFYLHWRYTGDDEFLRERAYPWCSDVGACMLESAQAGGRRDAEAATLFVARDFRQQPARVARTEFQLRPDVSQDAVSIIAGNGRCAAGNRTRSSNGPRRRPALGDFHTDATGLLLIDAKTALPASHRHLSNLIGLHPFNLITCEGDAQDARRIQASLAQWDQLGTSGWCGYSFSWMSCLRSRVGDAEAALRNLDIFCKAFTLRNGFHANGDQTRSGYSSFVYRPFTLEGNFLAAQAVQEMLLQSWSPTPGSARHGDCPRVSGHSLALARRRVHGPARGGRSQSLGPPREWPDDMAARGCGQGWRRPHSRQLRRSSTAVGP